MREYRVRFIQDTDPMSPREWDNVGHMVCWHRRYNLGDKQPSLDPEEWLEAFQEDYPKHAILPLYLYDHSGITISASSFSCSWDSGQVGWIYATPEDVETAGCKWDDVERILRSEVDAYDRFLTGAVFGYVVEVGEECDQGHTHWEIEDYGWGFSGDNLEDSGALDHIADEHIKLARKSWEENGVEYP